MSHGRYCERVRSVQKEMSRYHVLAIAALLIEQLAAIGRPVLRSRQASVGGPPRVKTLAASEEVMRN